MMSSSRPLHLLNRLQPYKALGLRYKKTLRYNINIQSPQEPLTRAYKPAQTKKANRGAVGPTLDSIPVRVTTLDGR